MVPVAALLAAVVRRLTTPLAELSNSAFVSEATFAGISVATALELETFPDKKNHLFPSSRREKDYSINTL